MKKENLKNCWSADSLKIKTQIFYELYYTKGMMEGLLEFSGHIEIGNCLNDHFYKSLDCFISKLYDLHTGTKYSEHNLGKNIDYLIKNYDVISWGNYEIPDISWNCPSDGKIYCCPTIKKSCKPSLKDLQNLKRQFNKINKYECTNISRNWRSFKVCHTGTVDQLKKGLKPLKYKELFKILDDLSKIYNKIYFYLTGSTIGFNNLSEDGKMYKSTDLKRLELYEKIRSLYFENKIKEISDEEFINQIKKINIL